MAKKKSTEREEPTPKGKACCGCLAIPAILFFLGMAIFCFKVRETWFDRLGTGLFFFIGGIWMLAYTVDFISGRNAKPEGEDKNIVRRAIDQILMRVIFAGMYAFAFFITVGLTFGGPILAHYDVVSWLWGIVISLFGLSNCFVGMKTYLKSKLHLRRLKRREAELEGQRLPENRRKRLRERVPLYRKLPDELKPKLEAKMILFLEEVKFQGNRIREITEEMRDLVAAEACPLIVNRSFLDYRQLKTVELWEDLVDGKWPGTAGKECVCLHWSTVEEYLSFDSDNYNITLHEFAHVLDQADDWTAQSIPVPTGTKEADLWQALLDEEFPRLAEAHASGRGHVIRKYGLTIDEDGERRPEFFTCATEAFFERSTRLRDECPEIYNALKDFYRLDPAAWS